MARLWSVVMSIILLCAICQAQVNFTPGWGKRGVGQGAGDPGCKTPMDSILYIYKLIQAEAQKIIDCERLSNM